MESLITDTNLELWLSETAEVECGHSCHWIGTNAYHDEGFAVCYMEAVCFGCGDVLKYPACQMWKDWVDSEVPKFSCEKCNSVYVHVYVMGLM